MMLQDLMCCVCDPFFLSVDMSRVSWLKKWLSYGTGGNQGLSKEQMTVDDDAGSEVETPQRGAEGE